MNLEEKIMHVAELEYIGTLQDDIIKIEKRLNKALFENKNMKIIIKGLYEDMKERK